MTLQELLSDLPISEEVTFVNEVINIYDEKMANEIKRETYKKGVEEL